MTHYMNLHALPFSLIQSGQKTIELRLYDEKRRLIKVGDTIVFTHSDDGAQRCAAVVKALHIFPDFAVLYTALPLEKCGYLPEELSEASPEDMNVYYSQEKQSTYGVVGIEIQRIEGELE